ncbi:MAG: hypothetical protein R2737_01835 [Candidatus Nanopelagicales bacterium]
MGDDRYTLHFDVEGDLLAAGHDCEESVFLRWFGNTRDQLAEEYGRYEDTSVFLVVADGAGEAVGACRLIVPGEPGLKTLHDLGREPWRLDGVRSARAAGLDPDDTWDIATLGVRDGMRARGVLVAAALYHGLIAASRANGFRSVVTIMDDPVRELVTGIGMLTHLLPGASSGPYLGSAGSTPVYGHCQAMIDGQRRIAPEAYRLVSLGIGLDGISVPEPEAFRLSRTVGTYRPAEVLDPVADLAPARLWAQPAARRGALSPARRS